MLISYNSIKPKEVKMTITSIIILTLSFHFILSNFSTHALSPLQSFTQCLLNTTIISTSSSPSYTTILKSSAQNLRFLASPSYTKPQAIITPTTEAQVSSAVTCAHKHNLQIRTRSGGHDYEAMSYVSDNRDQFIILDLTNLRRIEIDSTSHTAWVQTGATLGELYYNVFTKTNGKYGFPAGICPTVGIGGHVSGGGIGTLTRKFGTAADNVVDARIVGVDGRILNRSAMGEDLFWAVRGGGAASFGVVLAYQVKLAPVPPVVTVFDANRNLRQNATKIVTRWQQVAPNFDENLLVRIVAQRTMDNNSPSMQVLFQSLFLGTRTELFSVMSKSFPELGLKPEECTEMNWLQSVLFFNGMQNQGIEALLSRTPSSDSSFKAKSDFVSAPIKESDWEIIWKFLMDAQDEPLNMIMDPFGGQMNKISPAATPFPHRQGILYNIQYFMRWSGADDQETQKHLNWMRSFYSFMTPYVTKNPRAAYYNYKDLDLGRNQNGNVSYASARVWGEKYFKDNFKRLTSVKGSVDPENFFRNEQSIPPILAQRV